MGERRFSVVELTTTALEAQLQFLRDNTCDEIQGFFYSRPLSSAGITAFLRERQRVISP